MSGTYRIADKASEIEFTEKRSRFIGRCFPVSTEGEALACLADIRSRHWDASHNCFAYRIGENAPIARFSDDGEPSGTAGMPIMDVLVKSGITDCIVIVTRYFGGILLGAGGLVHAYSRSAAEAVREAGAALLLPAVGIQAVMEYGRYGQVEPIMREWCENVDAVFGGEVTVTAMIEKSKADGLIMLVTEKTNGRVIPSLTETEGCIRIKC